VDMSFRLEFSVRQKLDLSVYVSTYISRAVFLLRDAMHSVDYAVCRRMSVRPSVIHRYCVKIMLLEKC